MNKTFKVAIAAVALAGAASGARADLTIDGAVGLPLNPTAQIPQQGGVRLQANYFDQGDFGPLSQKTYGIVAAGRVADRIELSGGFNRNRVSGGGFSNDQDGVAIGAKYLITRESDPAGVRLAVGAGHNRAQFKNTFGYGVATKYLGELSEGKLPITGHLGVRYDDFNIAGADSKVSVFAGVEVPVADAFAIVGELQSKRIKGGDSPYSASIRYRREGQPLGVSVGIARTGLGLDNGLFAQLGYTFGG